MGSHLHTVCHKLVVHHTCKWVRQSTSSVTTSGTDRRSTGSRRPRRDLYPFIFASSDFCRLVPNEKFKIFFRLRHNNVQPKAGPTTQPEDGNVEELHTPSLQIGSMLRLRHTQGTFRSRVMALLCSAVLVWDETSSSTPVRVMGDIEPAKRCTKHSRRSKYPHASVESLW